MSWAWLVPAFSVASFLLIVFVGKYLPKGGAFLAPIAVLAGFVVFVFLLNNLLANGSSEFSVGWLETTEAQINWGMIIDPLSVTMLGVVTFIALGIQLFSWSYMQGENRFAWYFAVHSLFAASMLTLVLANNLLLLYIAWELVGLCSYLLIGFWYDYRPAAEAAKKAFVTTRLGDVGLLIGILLLFKETGTFEISEIFQAASGLEESVLTIAAGLLFLGAMGKSAQFPFHVWLPDAMEGPTPVSALIHAATMVVAGVYLVARMLPLFELAPTAMWLVASIGLITVLLAGTMALVMTDLKRILAYSTVSHLGFMMLALGFGGLAPALFHLVVHAFAKAMLFLSAGSISHATHTLDIREMGGLLSRMPVTGFCFSVGALTLAGLPPLSGFFSKDEVLLSVLHGGNPVFFGFALLGAFLSALYMARTLFMVFGGNLKPQNVDVMESPPLMVGPMVVFAIFSLGLGLLAFDLTDSYHGIGSFLVVDGHHGEGFHLNIGLAAISVLIATIAFTLAWLTYVKGLVSATKLSQRFPRVHQMWERKYWIDDLYQWVINNVILIISEAVALFDRKIINDGAVNGAGLSLSRSGYRLRHLETGRLSNYALGMAVGVLILVVFAWMVLR